MKWPRLFRSIRLAVFEERAASLEAQLKLAQAEVTYWRTRCERLIDAGLARRGEISSPAMVDVAPASDYDSTLRGLFGGLGFSSIPGVKPLGLAHPGQDAGRRADSEA